jgi:hypothetical protein
MKSKKPKYADAVKKPTVKVNERNDILRRIAEATERIARAVEPTKPEPIRSDPEGDGPNYEKGNQQ